MCNIIIIIIGFDTSNLLVNNSDFAGTPRNKRNQGSFNPDMVLVSKQGSRQGSRSNSILGVGGDIFGGGAVRGSRSNSVFNPELVLPSKVGGSRRGSFMGEDLSINRRPVLHVNHGVGNVYGGTLIIPCRFSDFTYLSYTLLML